MVFLWTFCFVLDIVCHICHLPVGLDFRFCRLVVMVGFGLVWCFVFSRQGFSNPGCPGTHCVDQAGLELRNPPTSTSQVLGLKVCAITARLSSVHLYSQYLGGKGRTCEFQANLVFILSSCLNRKRSPL